MMSLTRTTLYSMSFVELLAEIPRLTPQERREMMRAIREVEGCSQDSPGVEGYLSRRDERGQVLLSAPRLIRQVEVDAILEEFP